MIRLLMVNTLIFWKEENKIMRILWVNENITSGFAIDIYTNKYVPEFIEIPEIIHDLKEDRAKVLSKDPLKRIVFEEDLKEHHKERRDVAWEVVSYIVDNCGEPKIYNTSIRAEYITQASEKFGVTKKSIYKYLKRYWQRGKTKNALLPDYYNCGGKGKAKSAGNLKRGRPRKGYFSEGVNVDNKISEIFRIALNKHYYTTTENSLTTAYQLMIKEYFTDEYRYENGVKKPIILSEDKIPSLGQFRYWFEKERNQKEEISSRTSAKRYNLENRGLMGDSTIEAQGPGSIFQIDATIADVYLVSRYHKSHIIGRPIIYSVIDIFSRLIVALYVGLEGPSWAGAMNALANATMNKREFCKEYGIDIKDSEWPVEHLPESLICDRGEFEGFFVEPLISGLNIKVSNTASYRGDMKAIVERYFKTIHTTIKPYVPGFVGGDFRERGGQDYRLDAKLNLYDFTRLIIKCILQHNNFNYLKSYKRDLMMIEDDIKPIPIQLWEWGIQNRAGKLRLVEQDIVKLHLMPRGNASITSRGIRFKGILYGTEKAIKERWFEKARNKGSWKVEVTYDPRVMDYIYIIDENGKDFEKCFLLKHEDRYINKTLEEIEYLLEFEKETYKENEHNYLQSKVDLIADIEEIVSEAKNKSIEENVNKESKASRLRGIAENRSREKTINRESEFLELANEPKNQEAGIIQINSKEENFQLSDTSLIRKIQKERLKNE